MGKDRNFEKLVHELRNLGVEILQFLCIEKMYTEEAAEKDKGIDEINGKRFFSHDKLESFQKNGFIKIWKLNLIAISK